MRAKHCVSPRTILCRSSVVNADISCAAASCLLLIPAPDEVPWTSGEEAIVVAAATGMVVVAPVDIEGFSAFFPYGHARGCDRGCDSRQICRRPTFHQDQ